MAFLDCSASRRCIGGGVRKVKTCLAAQPKTGPNCELNCECCVEEGPFQCDVSANQAEDCNPELPDCDYEICGNGLDDDCDGTTDEDDDYGECTRDIPCDDEGEDGAAAQCDGTCRMRGEPVDLYTSRAYVGPHEVARVHSDEGGSADLAFTVLFDSIRNDRDQSQIASSGAPTPATVSPGFRHSLADRLIVVKDAAGSISYVAWEHQRGRSYFYRRSISDTGWIAEPGLNAHLQHNGTRWRLLTPSADLIDFEEGPSTWLHPSVSIGTQYWSGFIHHVRMKRFYPGGAAARSILLLYEDEAQDATTPYDADKIPKPACTGLVPGATDPDCTAPRGLLVKAGVVYGASAPLVHGPSFELHYTFGGGVGSSRQYLIAEILGGAARIDGAKVSALATLSYTGTSSSGTTRRLEKVTSRVACTSSNDSCTMAKYAWEANGELTTVYRPATNAKGDTAVLVPEESFTWNPGGTLSAHASVGTVLSRGTTTVLEDGTITQAWSRNGAPFEFRFDAQGNPLSCSDGSCGDAREDKLYQEAKAMQSNGKVIPYTLGPSQVMNADGTFTFRSYTERGNILFECTAVPTSAVDEPSCYLGAITGTIHVTRGYVRRAVRRYYDLIGDSNTERGFERLRVEVVYDPDTANTTLAFPAANSTDLLAWRTTTNDLSSCASLTPTVLAGSHDYALTVFDYNSDGDATLNETTIDTSIIPDVLPVRVNRAAASDGSTGIQRLCTTTARDDKGRIIATRELSSGVLRRAITYGFHGLPAEKTMSNGRVATVTRYRGAGATDPVVTLQTCSSTSRYDAEGRLACFTVPQASGDPMTVATSLATGNGVYARRRGVLVSGRGTSVQRYQNELASGAVFESGVGDGASGGAVEGNRVRRLLTGGTSAAKATTLAAEEHYDSTLLASGLLWKSTETYNSNGFGSRSSVYQGSSTLRSQQDRTVMDEDGRTETLVQQISSTGSSATSYFAYGAPGWDVLTDVWEADGDHVEHEYGGMTDPANEFGRQLRVRRAGVIAKETAYKRDGLILTAFGPGGKTDVVSTYTYDALRRLIKENRYSSGQIVDYTWLDDTRLSKRVVKGSDGTVVDEHSYTWDGLGRLVEISAKTGAITRKVRTIRYDDKGSFAGSWNGVTLSSGFNRGRVAYVEDEWGATFYEYDGVGRVTQVVRYEGALSGWNPTTKPLKVIGFSYGSANELVTLSYPSGRTVSYTYGNDKERPTSVSTSGLGTVVSEIAWEPSGAPSFWKFQGVSGRDHTVSRDYLGRVTRLQDRYASSAWSDVSYTYDGDGDVLYEIDSSPARTWLHADTAAPKTRKYGYEGGRHGDVLKSWDDNGKLESVVYKSDGRRDTETDNGVTFTFLYSITWPERLLSKTNSTVTSSQEVSYGYDIAGRITTIDNSANGSIDTTLGYGALGNVATRTTSAGTSTDRYDHDTRLLGIDEPTGSTWRFRYAFGRAPLEEVRTTSSGTWSYETVYLAGQPIAQVAASPSSSPTLRNLHTDRMGVVRKTATTGGTSLQRMYMDAWGGSSSVPSATIVDNNVDPMPAINWRYPGQYVTGSNGWRHYLPLTGQYAGVEPLHAMTAATFVGPQAYAYAAGRPLRWIDPNGAMILPPDPSGLGSDWVLDPTHRAPNGMRLRHPSGWYLDFDRGGKGGPKGRNAAGSGPHWHLNDGDRHLRPGTEIDDPPDQCEDQGDGQSVEVEDEAQGNDYYRALADCDVMDFACQQGVQHILWLPIFISPAQLAPILGGAAVEGPLLPAAEAAWAY